MTPSKKEKLINCLKKLQMQELNDLILSLEERDLSRVRDLNATLTAIVFNEVFAEKYCGKILANPNSEFLRQFCLNEIGDIKLNSVFESAPSHSPSKIKR